ncbi:MAG: amidohydrolase family protein [Candidatus Thorarchaeota archaeon]
MAFISILVSKSRKKQFISVIFQTLILLLFIVPIFNSKAVIQTNALKTEVDYIFYNANIITIDYSNYIVEAMAIKDGIMFSLGTSENILESYTTTLAENSFDMNKATIIPGIIDGHSHLIISSIGNDAMPFEEAQQKALSFGYTTLNEKTADSWINGTQFLLDAEAADELILRVNAFPVYNLSILDENNKTTIVRRWYPIHAPILDHTRKFRVPGIKIFVDGAYGNRGIPAMTVPYTPELLEIYASSSLYGDLYFNQSGLDSIVDEIQDLGFSCAFHAMGDRAIETVLNAIEFALNGSANDLFRHQIEHNSMMRDDLIEKAISLGTIHSVRGYFPTYWQDEDEGLYNSTILGWYANRYSLPGLGIHSYLETDFGWSVYIENDLTSTRNINPFLHMWGLVTRKAITENGTIIEPHPWIAEHEISAQMALEMMTLEGAYAVKQEDYLGSFENGKYADLVVLSDDPINCDVDAIKDIEVLLTMINGKIEYQKDDYYSETQTSTTTTITGLNDLILVIIFISGLFMLQRLVLKRR